MKQEEIIESNKLILKFDIVNNVEYSDKAYFNVISYHKSWDSLMPVVEKIEQIIFELCKSTMTNGTSTLYPQIKFGEFMWSKHKPYFSFISVKEIDENYEQFVNGKEFYLDIHSYGNSKIESVYKVIVEFIKWYNVFLEKKYL